MEITVRIDIDDQYLIDIMVTAIEEGSNYWIEEIPDNWQEIFTNKKGVSIKTLDDDGVYTVDMYDLAKGVEQYIDLEGMYVVLDDYDANDADLILQYAIFDEIIYG